MIIAIAAVVGQFAGAAIEPHDHEIPEIVVTADPLGTLDAHFAAPVHVLTAKDLQKESTRTIGEAVSGQLGVTSSDFGSGVGRPVIRGLGGARVRVLDSGIGSLDASAVSADHGVALEPLFAEQIEILRGPATLLYGSGASGGLVNVASGRIPETMPAGFASTAYGHYDSVADAWLGAFKLDAGVGSMFALHLDGLARRAEDLEIPGFAAASPGAGETAGRLPNSDAATENYSGGVSVIGEHGFLGFNISRFDNDYGVPGAHGDESGTTEPLFDGPRIEQTQTRYDVTAAYELNRPWLRRIKFRWGYGDYAHDEIEASGTLGTRLENNEWEGRVEVIMQPYGRWDGMFGIQLRDKEFDASGEEAFVPPADFDSQAVFLFEKADFGDVHVDLGLRFETQDAAARGSRTVSHDLLSVSGGATWRFDDAFVAGLSLSRSQRAPTIEELFASGPHLASNTFEIGDSGLGDETSRNIDVFWRKQAGAYRFDFTVFYNAIDDFVFLQSRDADNDGVADRVTGEFEIVDDDEALLLVRQVQRDARFWGVELAGELTLFDNRHGRSDLRLWTDYVEGELDDGTRLPRLPPLRYGLGLEWERGQVTAGLSAVRVTRARRRASLETPTPGYTMVNLHAAYTVSAGPVDWSVFARATNLTDDTARRHTSLVKDLAPLPGIGVLIGVRAQY